SSLRSIRPFIARSRLRSVRPAIISTLLRNAAKDSSNVPRMCLAAIIAYQSSIVSCCCVVLLLFAAHLASRVIPSLSKSTRDIILRLFLGWICENLCRRSKLDQPPEVHEGGVIRDPAGLLHIVGHRYNGVFRFWFVNQFLDFRRSDRIERRTRLIHQDDFRLYGERACDAEPLLLTT